MPTQPRFVPVSQLGGVPQAQPGQSAPRFQPISRPGSQPQPVQGGGGGGSNPLSSLGATLGQGMSTLNQLKNFVGGFKGPGQFGLQTGPGGLTLGNAAGGLTGGMGLAQGIQSGNIPQSIGGAAQLGSSLASIGGYPGISNVLGAVGGPLSIASGLASGNWGSVLGGIAPTLGAAGSAITALAPAASTAASIGSALSAAAAPAAMVAAVPAMALANTMKKNAERDMNQMRESGAIKKDMATALPQAMTGAQSLYDLQAGRISLDDAAGRAAAGSGAGAAISRFISTRGGDTGAGKGVGTGGLEDTIELAPGVSASRSALLSLSNLISEIRIQDALARSGGDMGMGVTGTPNNMSHNWGLVDPSTFGQLLSYAGPQFDPNTPEGKFIEGGGGFSPEGIPDVGRYVGPNPYYNRALAQPGTPLFNQFLPGQSEQGLVDYAKSINPNYANSVLATLLGQLPSITPPSLSPEQIAANVARQQGITQTAYAQPAEEQSVFPQASWGF